MINVNLQANGFSLSFDFASPAPTAEGWFEYSLSLESEGLVIRKRGSLTRRDIIQLTSYLREHIGPNYPHQIDAAAYNYVPMELDFEFRAYVGEIESWNDGVFTLSVMIAHCLKSGEGRVYHGVMGTVETAEVIRFCAEFDRLTSLSNSKDPAQDPAEPARE